MEISDNNKLPFDIVIVTRNRQPILKLSLPTMLSQSRLPHRLIVVDSSDDHPEVQQIVKNAVGVVNAGVDLQVIRSASGITHQRNVGLTYVQSPVVFFPDDDVLWFPGVTEAVMRVYERDKEGIVGCVVPAVSPVYPPGVFDEVGTPYHISLRDRLARMSEPLVRPIESRLFLDPLHPADRWMSIWGAKDSPAWLREEDAELCGPVIGYRMSFRTSVIRSVGGFDENLGRYSMYEDMDASLGSLESNINIIARRAKLFHYREPGARVHGAEFGMMAILNRTYVVCKHSLPGSLVRQHLKRYLYYKLFRYFLQAHTRYGRQRLRGAFYGILNAHRILDAPRQELVSRYLGLRRKFAGD
jgi:glycosyltransferase involved in cell wall biosynthesis